MKNQTAEWILSLLLPRERAMAVVGDFSEDARGRDDLWFWSSILRIVFSRVAGDLMEDPLRMLGLAVRANILYLWATVWWFVGFAILMSPVLAVIVRMEHGKMLSSAVAEMIVASLIGFIVTAAALICAFRTGSAIARRMPGKEMAACVAFCLMGALLSSVVQIAVMRIWPDRNAGVSSISPGVQFIGCVLFYASLFGGSVRTRVRSLRSGV